MLLYSLHQNQIDAPNQVLSELGVSKISATTGDGDIYRYETLLDPSTHIRLLELEDTETWEEQGARCKLTVWPLEHAPPYHTISYTWGVPTPTRRIRLEQKALLVPESSYKVLKQLAYFKTSRYYWIDAICIAQGDIAEKNGQAALMGSIYRRSEHVLVCLDSLDDKVEVMVQMVAELEELAPLKTKLPARKHEDTIWADLPPEDRGHSADVENADDALMRDFAAFSVALGHRLADFMVGLTELSERSYFSRVWIIQEIILASSASIYYGKTCVPVAAIERYMHAVGLVWDVIGDPVIWRADEHTGFIRKLRDFALPLIYSEQWRVKGSAMRLIEYRVLAETNSGDQLFLLHEALLLTQHRSCTDRRDSIYGMLGLIDWVGAQPIQPDYNKSAYRVAVEYCTSSKMNVTEAEIVVEALGVGSHDAELQDAIMARQMQLLYGANDIPKPSGTIWPTSVKGGYYAIEIFEESCHWVGPGTFLVQDGEDGGYTPFHAVHLRWRDWLIYQRTSETRVLPKHGFLASWSGENFDIVDRAYFPREWPETYDRKFEVSFNPEDFIVSACILAEAYTLGVKALFERLEHLDKPTYRLLATPVCQHPMSSFAKLRAREDERFDRELMRPRRLRGYV